MGEQIRTKLHMTWPTKTNCVRCAKGLSSGAESYKCGRDNIIIIMGRRDDEDSAK